MRIRTSLGKISSVQATSALSARLYLPAATSMTAILHSANGPRQPGVGRKIFNGQNPLGKVFAFTSPGKPRPLYEILASPRLQIQEMHEDYCHSPYFPHANGKASARNRLAFAQPSP